MSKEAAEAIIAQAGEVLARHKEREKRYGPDSVDGTVIRFTKSWGSPQSPLAATLAALQDTTYSYAAVRVNGLWYTTGPKSPKGYRWEDLLAWMDSGDYPVTDLQRAMAWEPIGERHEDS